MDSGWATILAAIIPIFAAGIAWLMRKFHVMHTENKQDHAGVMEQLRHVTKVVEKTGDRLNEHIDWHVKK